MYQIWRLRSIARGWIQRDVRTLLSSIDIWLVKNESLGKVKKKKKKYDEVNDRNGLEKSWQIGNMIGNGISEIGLLASSI